MSRFFKSFILAILMVSAMAGLSSAAQKLALVIGNDAYQSITPLKKAVNDAESVDQALQQLGFDVSRVSDVGRREMNVAIQNFIASVGEGDIAAFFYAGHGVEIAGKNYLLPVDVPGGASSNSGIVETESIAVDDILIRLKERNAQLNLLILDACRNNPFAATGTRSVGGSAGLARISAPQGTFVIYSADIGEAALDRLSEDDQNSNSVFTRTLVPLLGKNGLDLVDTAREVRRQVRTLAQSVNHQQTPAYYDAVLGDFFLAGEPKKKEEEVKFVSLTPLKKDQPRQTIKKKNPKAEIKSAKKPDKEVNRAMVVTGGEKDSIKLWDADTAQLIAELEGEKLVFSAVAFTGGGSTLAIATEDGALFSYEIPAFKKRNAIYPGFKVSAIAETEDGTLILGGADGAMAAIDGASFDLLWREFVHDDVISPIVISKDGKTFITASGDGSIAETQISDGTVIGRVTTLPGLEITDIAFLNANTVVAVHEDGTIAHLNLKTGKVLTSFKGSKGWISSVDTLDGGKSYVTSGVDGVLSFWTLGLNKPQRRVQAHSDVAAGAKFMNIHSERRMISAGFDGLLRIWDKQSKKVLADLDHGKAILYFDMHGSL